MLYIISTEITSEEINKIFGPDSEWDDDIISEYTSEEIIKVFGCPKTLGKKKYYYYDESLDGCAYVKNIWCANIREDDTNTDYHVVISEKISEYLIDDHSCRQLDLELYTDKKFIQPLKNYIDRKLNRQISRLDDCELKITAVDE